MALINNPEEEEKEDEKKEEKISDEMLEIIEDDLIKTPGLFCDT